MTEKERKYIARRLLSDPYGSFFQELSEGELKDFYKTKCRCEVVPGTVQCAIDEAREILGEPEASRLTLRQLKNR
jgi:hypothetical protein